jgi:predicted nucleotidyltransferase component of viral defense system
MTLDPIKHKNILVQILIDIYSDTTIAPYLGFKGGTAAYLFHNLERFSVDLDFDLLHLSKEEYVRERIEMILTSYGAIKDSSRKKNNMFFLLAYNNKEKNAQNIKIDINRNLFGSEYEVRAFNGVSMIVMIQEDMFAHKLVAMHERIGETNRDIFDVWFFAKNNWGVTKQIIKTRTGLEYKDFLELCINELEGLKDTNILKGLGELVNEKQKAWVKSRLVIETLVQLKLRLEAEV